MVMMDGYDGSWADSALVGGSRWTSSHAGVGSPDSGWAGEEADLAAVVGAGGTASQALRSDLVGSDGAGSHTGTAVLQLVGSASSGGNAGSVAGLEAGLAGDTVGGTEAGHAVGSAGEALLAEVVGEVAVSAVGDAASVEEELSGSAGEGGGSAGTSAASEAVVSIAGEATAIDADALVVEESAVADVGADSTVRLLAVWALGVRDATLGGGVDGETGQAWGAGVDVAWALGAVGVASHAVAVEGSVSVLAAGHAVTVGDDAGRADADTVGWVCASGTGGLALALEEVEAGEAAGACASAVAGVAGVGAVGADSASGNDGSVDAAGAVGGSRAGSAVGWAAHADLLVGIKELGILASLLADGAGFDVSRCAGVAVGRSHWATVAGDGAGHANSLETELVLSAGDWAGAVEGDWSLLAGSAVAGSAVASGALGRAGSALSGTHLVESIRTVVNAGRAASSSALKQNSGTSSPASTLVEDLVGRAGDAVGGASKTSGALEVADLADTVACKSAIIAGLDAALTDSWGLQVSLTVLAAGAERRVVHAGLAGSVTRHAVPVASWAVSDGAGGTDGVAGTVVHVKFIGAVEADEVLSALEAASGAALADWSKGGEAVVAAGLADSALEDEGTDAVAAVSGGSALLAASGAGNALSGRVDEVLGRADALVVDSLSEGVDTGCAGVGINTVGAVRTAGSAVPDTVGRDSEVGLGGAGALAVVGRSGESHAAGAVRSRWADAASTGASNTVVLWISVVAVHTDADALGQLDDSVLGGETLDAKFQSLLALGAEGISVTVGLHAWTVGSGVVSGLADASLMAWSINSSCSVLGWVAWGAGSGSNWAS
jgi:hypothetical protein